VANEITLTQRLQLSNGLLIEDINPPRISINQTTQTLYKNVVSIGTTEESVTYPELTTPGVCYIKNLDTTNYVQWGTATTVYSGRLLGTDIPACFRLDNAATTLYLKANTAACKVLILVLDK
jgi:hypothetical protein